MLDQIIQTIPQQPGSYALWLHLSQTHDLTIGRLGTFALPAGDYVYLGSARGPGGLRARLGRHLRGDGKPHWHIDWLRAVAQARGFGFWVHDRRRDTIYRVPTTTECNLSQQLATLPKFEIVAPGFGASDCRSGCAAHLVYFQALDVDQITSLLNCEIHILGNE
jgi:Uri superfamily endonuclease